MSDVKNLDEGEFLQLYGSLMEELRQRKLIRSSNNPVSDYAEKIVCEKLKLLLQKKSRQGYDAIDENTSKISDQSSSINQTQQVKAIRCH